MKIIIFKDFKLFTDELFNETLKILPLTIRNHILKSKISDSQKRSLIAYLLLVYLLKKEHILKELPIYKYNENGKPYLLNYPNYYFSISHSNNFIAVALANQEIGIDIEKICDVDSNLIKYTMNELEYQDIIKEDNKEKINIKFFTYWTKKESYIKYLGISLKKDLKNILNDNDELCFYSYNTNSYVLSLCLNK